MNDTSVQEAMPRAASPTPDTAPVVLELTGVRKHFGAGERRVVAVDGVDLAVDGTPVRLRPDSLCVHSDTPGAVAIAGAVRRALGAAGVDVRPFAPATTR